MSQNVQTGHHGDLRKMRHVKQIEITQVYEKWYYKYKIIIFAAF